jgi:hypothetical protein
MIEIAMPDGLYRVKAATFVAGFVVENGRVILCAPILRKKLKYWARFAVRVCADPVKKVDLTPKNADLL